MIEGRNDVILRGEIYFPELKYTATGKALFKSKIRIPTTDSRSGDDRNAFLRIVAWEEFADYLDSLPAKSHVRVSGRIQERSYTDRSGQKKNSTDIVINGAEQVDPESGENSFVLQGEMVWPELRQVGQGNTSLFKCKLKIPFVPDNDPDTVKYSYVRITAWDQLAEDLATIADSANPFVKASGHIQDRSWTNAETGQKRIFTDAIVTNFLPVSVGEGAV